MPTKKTTFDEYMITITLNSAFINIKTMKQQLFKTYNIITSAPFETGEGVAELTLNGNVHYHIKTQDPLYKIQAWVDSLKLHKTTINECKHQLFGFVRVDSTYEEDKYKNYDYLHKSSEQTLQAWKRAGVKPEFKTNWIYNNESENIIKIRKNKSLKQVVIQRVSNTQIDKNIDSEEEIILGIFKK